MPHGLQLYSDIYQGTIQLNTSTSLEKGLSVKCRTVFRSHKKQLLTKLTGCSDPLLWTDTLKPINTINTGPPTSTRVRCAFINICEVNVVSQVILETKERFSGICRESCD